MTTPHFTTVLSLENGQRERLRWSSDDDQQQNVWLKREPVAKRVLFCDEFRLAASVVIHY